jgi:hypothetical protein
MSQKQSIWGVAANVMKEQPYREGDKERWTATHKFDAGAKVYIAGAYWGMGDEEVAVVGHYHGKHAYITAVTEIRYLENFRAERIYSPAVIERLEQGTVKLLPWDAPIHTKVDAEKAAQWFNERANAFRS